MRILVDNESLGCSQNPSDTPHTDCSPYFLIIKLPAGTRRSVYWFHVTSCLAYIVVKLATISHDSETPFATFKITQKILVTCVSLRAL